MGPYTEVGFWWRSPTPTGKAATPVTDVLITHWLSVLQATRGQRCHGISPVLEALYGAFHDRDTDSTLAPPVLNPIGLATKAAVLYKLTCTVNPTEFFTAGF